MSIPRKQGFRKRKNEAFLAFLFVALFGGLTVFLVVNNILTGKKRSELSHRVQELQTQLAELQARKEQLKEGVVEAESVEFQEEALREKGLYQKPGEEVITVLPPEEQGNSSEGKSRRAWWNPLTWF